MLIATHPLLGIKTDATAASPSVGDQIDEPDDQSFIPVSRLSGDEFDAMLKSKGLAP